jgi:tripartite-type tricarboxylate transporter receptor subunit TctC
MGDIVARPMGQWLSERLGQPFIIENRAGAAGNIATEAVVRAPADGYTLLLVNSGNAASAALYDKLNFDLLRDITPVAGIIRAPLIIEVNSSIPVKTVPELIAYAKANPGRVNYASVGSGTTNHITGELFKMMTGVNMVHVPYRGSAPALTAMLGRGVAGASTVAWRFGRHRIEFGEARSLRARFAWISPGWRSAGNAGTGAGSPPTPDVIQAAHVPRDQPLPRRAGLNGCMRSSTMATACSPIMTA